MALSGVPTATQGPGIFAGPRQDCGAPQPEFRGVSLDSCDVWALPGKRQQLAGKRAPAVELKGRHGLSVRRARRGRRPGPSSCLTQAVRRGRGAAATSVARRAPRPKHDAPVAADDAAASAQVAPGGDAESAARAAGPTGLHREHDRVVNKRLRQQRQRLHTLDSRAVHAQDDFQSGTTPVDTHGRRGPHEARQVALLTQ